MHKQVFILFFISMIFISCKDSKNHVYVLNDDWCFSMVGDTIWKPAVVPGSIQTDLLRLSEIPHPFIGNNEDSIQWVSAKDWRYKKHFRLSKEILNKKKHVMQFEGLDTYAKVYLNDSLILSAFNAFRRWEVDVSYLVNIENDIRIVFKSVDSIESNEAGKLSYTLPESPRVFTRKPQFQYGWDWGPTIKTMGVWRDVKLVSYDVARITDLFFQTLSVTDSIAEIKTRLSIEVPEKKRITVRITNRTDQETIETSIDVDPMKSDYEIPFTIKNPTLWWTHNLGAPYLYDLTIEILDGGKPIESQNKKLGIRSIELITDKDEFGESFFFKLNGHPFYAKGANYIPQNIFLSEVDRKDHLTMINDVVDSNMNMLRVWGGGIYENDVFYELCDEKGILIWQDFMFACAMYPGDPAFLENVKQEAIDNVKRLRQHPSIALWCGNNENSEGWHRWGWKDGKSETQQQKIWEGYYAVFNHILPRVVDSLHPSISYWESSPKYGRGDQRYQFEGDAHDWWVWHDGYPFEHFEDNVPRFISEFGFQSFPSYEAIKYFTGLDSLNIDHPSISNHQKHSRGFLLIREYMERDYPVPTLNDEDYVYVSQLVQAYGIIKGIHAHRRTKPYNMGTLYWQLNDCWPVISWSGIDGLGNWKALQYKVKKAFDNVLISSVEKNDTLNVSIINDSFKKVKGEFKAILISFDGSIIESFNSLTEVSENSNEMIYSLPLSNIDFDRKSSVLILNFEDKEHLHYFTNPKNLNLEKGEIISEFVKIDEGFEITLRSETLQKDVFLTFDKKGKISDNFFDLLPNTVKTVHFLTKTNEFSLKKKSLNSIK